MPVKPVSRPGRRNGRVVVVVSWGGRGDTPLKTPDVRVVQAFLDGVNAPRAAAAAAAVRPRRRRVVGGTPPSLDTLQASERESVIRVMEANWLPDEDVHESWIHSGWMPERKRVHASFIRTGQSGERVCRFRACGREAYVAVNKRDPSKVKLLANHCGDRFCMVCGKTRSFRIRTVLMGLLEHGSPKTEVERPRVAPTFCTFTLGGDTGNLSASIDHLYASFKRLRRDPLWHNAVQGGAAFLEVHWSERGQRWHPHLHCVMRSRFINQAALSDAWRKASGGSFIVDIRRVKGLKSAGYYVTKYASKPLDGTFSHSPALLDEAVCALKGRRLCFTYGDWYGTCLSKLADDPIRDAELSAENWVCVGTLESVFARAARGDPDAVAIRACLAKGRSTAEATLFPGDPRSG